jgi:hypothetical protein
MQGTVEALPLSVDRYICSVLNCGMISIPSKIQIYLSMVKEPHRLFSSDFLYLKVNIYVRC